MKTDLERQLIQQAQSWASEARSQRATVLEIYQLLGIRKGDWNGSNPVARKLDKILNALYEVDAVFAELDQEDWGQTDCDQYHGRAGRCPVNYEGANGVVTALIRILERE